MAEEELIEEPRGLDDKVLVEVWEMLGRKVKQWAKNNKHLRQKADDIVQDAIVDLIERSKREHVRNPLHLAVLIAHRRAVDATRAEGKLISMTEEGEPSSSAVRNYEDAMGGDLRDMLGKSVADAKDPAPIAEQRDYLDHILPDWRRCAVDGLSFVDKRTARRNTKRLERRDQTC